jgi:hypothetical protein
MVAKMAEPFGLLIVPPVEYCRGSKPSQTPKFRPRWKASQLPIAATMAVETVIGF